MTLIRGWRTFWRWWSTWLVAVGTSIAAFSPELYEALMYVWQNLPMDIKNHITPEWVRYIGAGIAAVGIPAKLVRQRRAHELAERAAES